jgi:DNA modification methylase
MEDKRAEMIFCDPPFNVKVAGNVSGKGKVKHGDFAQACGEMTVEEFTQFLTTVFRNLARFARDGSLHFVFMDWRHMGEMLAAGGAVYSELKNLVVWAKDNPGLGSLYRSAHELVFVFKHGTGPHINNIDLGRYGRNRSNVWHYESAATSCRKGNNVLALHPTAKPVTMAMDALLDCSNAGGIVLDAFLGSGTTLLAAERTGRVCYGIELNPRYVDVAVRRWQNLTGKDAVLASSGKTFNEMEQDNVR